MPAFLRVLFVDALTTIFEAFFLVFLAEFGDKSQLVCMTLSARYRAWPVLLGSLAAFAVLNAIAVLFGTMISTYLPETIVLAIVGTLFLLFGIQSFRVEEDDDDEPVKVGRHILISVFTLIFFAELGDKTQLSVAGMAAVEPAFIVWLAGTLALAITTLLGVWFGRMLLKKLSVTLIHRGAGVLFIVFALIAFYHLFLALS